MQRNFAQSIKSTRSAMPLATHTYTHTQSHRHTKELQQIGNHSNNNWNGNARHSYAYPLNNCTEKQNEQHKWRQGLNTTCLNSPTTRLGNCFCCFTREKQRQSERGAKGIFHTQIKSMYIPSSLLLSAMWQTHGMGHEVQGAWQMPLQIFIT